MNANPWRSPQDNLPLFIFNQIRSSQDQQVERAWAGALVLLVLVLLLFVAARIAGRQRSGRSVAGRLRRFFIRSNQEAR